MLYEVITDLTGTDPDGAIPVDPCNPSGSEDFAGTTIGLDNDGDLHGLRRPLGQVRNNFV